MGQNNLTPKPLPSNTAGYSLLELIIVVFMIGILSAIAAPAWLQFTNRQRLNTAQSQIHQGMLEAKSNALRDKLTWQMSVRQVNEQVQWAVHRADSNFIPPGVQWHNLNPKIQVYTERNDRGVYETTLDSPGQKTVTGPWRVQFNYKGNTNGQLGQITLIPKNNSSDQRCVYVSTLIGALRTGEDHDKPNDRDKYCY